MPYFSRRTSTPKAAPTPPASTGSGDAQPLPGAPVNPFSRAVHPREQFPRHYDLLMRDLFDRGQVPEDWQVISADESHLDEHGMEVEFTLLRTGTNDVWRRRVDVRHGQLAGIRDC